MDSQSPESVTNKQCVSRAFRCLSSSLYVLIPSRNVQFAATKRSSTILTAGATAGSTWGTGNDGVAGRSFGGYSILDKKKQADEVAEIKQVHTTQQYLEKYYAWTFKTRFFMISNTCGGLVKVGERQLSNVSRMLLPHPFDVVTRQALPGSSMTQPFTNSSQLTSGKSARGCVFFHV